MTETFSLDSHFSGKEPIVRSMYDRLLASLRKFGKIIEGNQVTFVWKGKSVDDEVKRILIWLKEGGI